MRDVRELCKYLRKKVSGRGSSHVQELGKILVVSRVSVTILSTRNGGRVLRNASESKGNEVIIEDL